MHITVQIAITQMQTHYLAIAANAAYGKWIIWEMDYIRTCSY